MNAQHANVFLYTRDVEQVPDCADGCDAEARVVCERVALEPGPLLREPAAPVFLGVRRAVFEVVPFPTPLNPAVCHSMCHHHLNSVFVLANVSVTSP